MAKKEEMIEEVKKLGLENLSELLESSVDDEPEDEVPAEEEAPVSESAASIADLFEGVEGLPEGFAAKAKVLFEVAVSEKALALAERKYSELEAAVVASQATKIQEDADQLDAYLSYVTEEWYKENQAIVESKFKVELAETFVTKMTALLAEYNVEIDPDQESIVESLEAKLDEANGHVESLVFELQESKKALAKTQVEAAISEATAGMSDVEAERFTTVLGEMEYVDQADFQVKIDVLKSALIKESKTSTVTESVSLTESIDIPSDVSAEKEVGSVMQSYVTALRKQRTR